MKFKLYRSYGALNSPPVFDAFEQGVKALGHEIVEINEDVSVIWSVLWQGRMAPNQLVYQDCLNKRKPIIIIEVGNLKRGETWRICYQHVNGMGMFGNDSDLDLSRPQKLGVTLSPPSTNRRGEILIASQHSRSLQWEGQPSMEQWIKHTIGQVKKYSSRRIVVRPHPRSPLKEKFADATIDLPKLIPNSYDSFNIDYNYHCVINYNSGPAVQAAIQGVPVICHTSSLAYPVGEKWENLENPQLPDREEWFLKLTHTEWTLTEIAKGLPLARLEFTIKEKLK